MRNDGGGEREIRDLKIMIPERFYPVRLDEDIDSDQWAHEVVAQVAREHGSEDHENSVVAELEELRIRLLATLNPLLTAAVYIRPEQFMSVGALLTFQIAGIEPGQDAAWFEAEARALTSQAAPEAHTVGFDTWQEDIPAGALVGVHQVLEYLAPDLDTGWVEARTVFGVFPRNATEMVQFSFTTADLAAFGDMRVETQQIVSSLELSLGPVA
jgi:hypothetical protein